MFADKHREPVDILEHTLRIRHICPTSPDTLRTYSFTENDPFVVGEAPHVYFAGNQPVYGEKWVTHDETQKLLSEARKSSGAKGKEDH